MHRILITDDLGPAGLALLEAAADVSYDVVKLPSPEKLRSIIGDYDAVITRSGTPLTAEAFRAGTRLKVAGGAIRIEVQDIFAWQRAIARAILAYVRRQLDLPGNDN